MNEFKDRNLKKKLKEKYIHILIFWYAVQCFEIIIVKIHKKFFLMALQLFVID